MKLTQRDDTMQIVHAISRAIMCPSGRVPIRLLTVLAALASKHAQSATAWVDWKPASCMPRGCFCEQIRSGLIAQPSNTFSSFAFVAIGTLVLLLSLNPMRGCAIFRRIHGLMYGAALVLIGLGSAFYHASLTFFGQILDVQGMYLFGLFILLYAFSKRGLIGDGAFVLLYCASNICLLLLQLFAPPARRFLFAGLLVAVIIVELRLPDKQPKQSSRLFYAAVGIMAVAFVIWALDLTRVACVADSVLQGHAIWHILGALAAFVLYLHYARNNSAGNTTYMLHQVAT